MKRVFLAIAILAIAKSGDAHAQELGHVLGTMDRSTATRIVHGMFGVGLLALAPFLLIAATSFTRIIIVFSILRMSLGLQSTPANFILISLALAMTFHIMSPVVDASMQESYKPYMNSEINEAQAIERTTKIFGDFMKRHIRDKDLNLFVEMAGEIGRKNIEPDDIRVLAPAFMTSELRRGFEIGFLIAIPFLLIDLIVATVVMSMGMMMMPPSIISLPIKIMFFVLIDGWNLIVGTLAKSFH